MLTVRAKVALAAAVLLGITGRIFGVEVFFGLAAATVMAVVLGWWSAGRSRGAELAVTTTVDARAVEVHGVATVRIVVDNRGPRSSPAASLDCTVEGRGGRCRTQTVELPPLEPGASARASFEVPSMERGTVKLRTWSLRFEDPLGVSRWRVPLPDELEVTVLPTTEPLGSALQSAGYSAEREATSVAAKQLGSGISGLRPYVIGDDFRRVHWPTTARTGRLVVREGGDREAPSTACTTILLDARRTTTDGDRRRWSRRPCSSVRALRGVRSHERRRGEHTELAQCDQFERAVSITASLVRAAGRPGSSLRLMLSSGIDTGEASGAFQQPVCLEQLAQVVPTDGGSLAPALAALAREGDRSGGTVIVVTTTTTAPEELQHLTSRRISNDVIVVVLIDGVRPESGEPAGADRPTQQTRGARAARSEPREEHPGRLEKRWLEWAGAGSDRIGATRRQVVFAGGGQPLALALGRDLGDDAAFERAADGAGSGAR